MPKLTCAIVEDEIISLTMVQALAEKTKLLDIQNTFPSAVEAIKWLVHNQVDLLFLDVEMPGMTGIELVRALTYKPQVIIISGKPNYAVDAFDLAVTDYLLKPVKDYTRFLLAVNKAFANHKQNLSRQGDDTIFVRVDSLLQKLNIEEILWVEAFGDYIKIQTAEKTFTVYSTLKKLQDKLPDNKFVRVHRSFVVNISKINNIDPNNLEINRKIIPISGTYKEDLLNKINVL